MQIFRQLNSSAAFGLEKRCTKYRLEAAIHRVVVLRLLRSRLSLKLLHQSQELRHVFPGGEERKPHAAGSLEAEALRYTLNQATQRVRIWLVRAKNKPRLGQCGIAAEFGVACSQTRLREKALRVTIRKAGFDGPAWSSNAHMVTSLLSSSVPRMIRIQALRSAFCLLLKRSARRESRKGTAARREYLGQIQMSGSKTSQVRPSFSSSATRIDSAHLTFSGFSRGLEGVVTRPGTSPVISPVTLRSGSSSSGRGAEGFAMRDTPSRRLCVESGFPLASARPSASSRNPFRCRVSGVLIVAGRFSSFSAASFPPNVCLILCSEPQHRILWELPSMRSAFAPSLIRRTSVNVRPCWNERARLWDG